MLGSNIRTTTSKNLYIGVQVWQALSLIAERERRSLEIQPKPIRTLRVADDENSPL